MSDVRKIVIASKNKDKIIEFRDLLAPLGIEFVGYTELLGDIEIEETGKTLEENAIIKAKFVFEKTGYDTISDDSGFFISALSGFPGVVSARFAEESGGYEGAFAELWKRCGGRSSDAKFSACIVFIGEGGKPQIFNGEINGFMTYPGRGSNGFGYCPIFVPNGYGMTFGEMEKEEKNKISHRSVAVHKFSAWFMAKIEKQKKEAEKLANAEKQAGLETVANEVV